MILHTIGGFHYLIRQSEHARQSAVVTGSLADPWLGRLDDRAAVLRATIHHDAGWDPWDDAPRIQSNGLPVPFDGMEKSDHDAIWTRSILGALDRLGPAEAAYIARHSMALQKGTEDDENARRELILALGRRAWRDTADEVLFQRVDAGFSALYLGDVVSLTGLAGWNAKLPVELIGPGGERLTVEVWRGGDWLVYVDPWPFIQPTLRGVWADAVVVPVGEEASVAGRLLHSPDHRVRVFVDVVPAGET